MSGRHLGPECTKKAALLQPWMNSGLARTLCDHGDGAYLIQIVDTTICFIALKSNYQTKSTPIYTP